MLYKKYKVFDNQIELMIPSEFSYNKEKFIYSKNHWTANIGTAVIDANIIKRNDRQSEELTFRLQDYYLEYKKRLDGFSCRHIIKRNIYGMDFGELIFYSKCMDYKYYHWVLIGFLEDREVVVALQCLTDEIEEYEHIFEIVTDSVKPMGNGGEVNADKSGQK